MYAEVAWLLVYSGTQVQPQIILDPDNLRNYLSVSYDCLKRPIHADIFSKEFSEFQWDIRYYSFLIIQNTCKLD